MENELAIGKFGRRNWSLVMSVFDCGDVMFTPAFTKMVRAGSVSANKGLQLTNSPVITELSVSNLDPFAYRSNSYY